MSRKIDICLFFILLMFMVAHCHAQQQALRAYDFINSVGVNTHWSYPDSAYYNKSSEAISAIRKLGVHHVRDGIAYPNVLPNLYGIYNQLATNSIHPELIVPYHPEVSAVQFEALLHNYPGTDAIEPPNEYDLSGDLNWASNLATFLPIIQQIGQDANLTVLGPSLTYPPSYLTLGDVGQFMHFNNFHWYSSGLNPETQGWGGFDAQGNRYGSIAYDINLGKMDAPGRLGWVTETGYVANSTGAGTTIPESVEAIYAPRLPLVLWNAGVKRTYIYELIDDPSSAVGYGLLRSDLTARPAYTALSNLMRLLSDSSVVFTPNNLSYTLTGNTTNIESSLLQKHDGSFWIAVWLTACIWNSDISQPISVPPQQVTLAIVGRKARHIWVFDSNGNTHSSYADSSLLSLQVSSAITLVKIL